MRKVVKKNLFLIKCLIVLVIIITGLLIFNTACKLTTIEIESGQYYTEDEIKNMLFTGKTDGYTILFYIKTKIMGIKDIPFVEKIDVELIDKNSIKIYVYDKAVIGCIDKMGKYMHFDREGIIVEGADEKKPGVPEITGLTFSRIVLNEKLDIDKKNMFNTILNITMLINKNGLVVDTVNFSNNYEVSLFTDNNIILLGKRETYDIQINNLKGIIKAADGKRLSIDMRSYSDENREVTAKSLQEK